MTKEMNNLPELPKGWALVRLREIGEIVTGTTPSKARNELYGNDFPFFKPTDLNTGYDVKTSEDGLSKKGIENARLLPTRSILITCIGATIGKTGLIRKEGASNQQINAIIPYDYVLPEFVYFICLSPQFQKSIIDNASATTLPILNKSKFESLRFPLPSLPEQHRIVAKIKELFTRLDAGVEALKRVKTELKRYRQAVLKYAFEGKLTEEWREAHKGELEHASVILERIRKAMSLRGTERRSKLKNNKNEIASLPARNDNLTELPEGWVWARMGEITEYVENVNPKAEPDKEFIYLDIASIDNSQQKITGPKKYSGRNAPSRAKQLVKSGDIIFSTVRTYLKNIAIVKEIYNGQIASTGFCVIRPFHQINSKFIFFITQTDDFLNPLTQLQRGTSYPAVRDSDVFSQIIPLPPLLEQHKIVEEIERRFSVADEVDKIVDQSRKQAERLRQSILKKAFKGKLVPQDPTDEPAEKLLERIKQEKKKTVG